MTTGGLIQVRLRADGRTNRRRRLTFSTVVGFCSSSIDPSTSSRTRRVLSNSERREEGSFELKFDSFVPDGKGRCWVREGNRKGWCDEEYIQIGSRTIRSSRGDLSDCRKKRGKELDVELDPNPCHLEALESRRELSLISDSMGPEGMLGRSESDAGSSVEKSNEEGEI